MFVDVLTIELISRFHLTHSPNDWADEKLTVANYFSVIHQKGEAGYNLWNYYRSGY